MNNIRKLQILFNASQTNKSYRKLSVQNVNPAVRLPNEELTEPALNSMEHNILLRGYNNNIPVIRNLLIQLENDHNNENIIKDLRKELLKLPNNTHPRIMSYGQDPYEIGQYITGKEWKNPMEFSAICKYLNILRMENLGNYTGHKSYYLMGGLAYLQNAIVQYTRKVLKEHSFKSMSVPDILPKTIIEACGMQTEGERNQVYKLDSGLCLSGTSEMALAGFYKDKILNEEELPIKVSAVSRCYRAETSGLREEKGIYRVHQFTKVEMFSVCSETQSEAMLKSFKDIEIALFEKLGIDFRVLDMPPIELGAPAYEKYDIEAWMPGRAMWGEISSCSNCTDYQSKRLNIQYRTKDNKLKHVHTVNGTAAAIPRLLISIIESYQNGSNTIPMPEVLQPYMLKPYIEKDKRIPEVKFVKYIPSEFD